MSSSIVITIVILAAIAWVAYLAISALRSRGPEEVPYNLAPGTTDDVLETKRLESVQLAAVVMSGFLAISMPIYYLTETNRQEGFVEEFHETAVERGHEWYVEFQCGDCHGAAGGGGAASFVEKRTGVSVNWEAPSINDVFYRYDREEVRFWVTFGRGNSPMPAWGVEGGGPMNESQVDELLDYMASEEFLIPQTEVLGEVEAAIDVQLGRLDDAQASVDNALVLQRQLIADINRADELAGPLTAIAEQARATLDSAAAGIDTDGDGLSDTAEREIVELTNQARAAQLRPGLSLDLDFAPDDPATNGGGDLEAAETFLATLNQLVTMPLADGAAPLLAADAVAVADILDGVDGDESADTDGDGLTDTQEQQLSVQAQLAARGEIVSIAPVSLDPQNEETSIGQPDLTTARETVANLETAALNANVTVENFERVRDPAIDALANLEDAATNARWEFDFDMIAANLGRTTEDAERAVGIFNGFCARCHTSGYSAGLAFTQEAGSGALGPALWDGRPSVQFLTDDDLLDFLIVGAEPNKPYGVNGFGSGRMPAFGALLSEDDLSLLAAWLRSGDLTGLGTDSEITAEGN